MIKIKYVLVWLDLHMSVCVCVTVISYYIQTSDADIPNPETAHSVEYHNLFEQFSGSDNNSYHKYFCGYNNNYCGCCLFN